jgi:Mn-dependent DtxR family transcriptional regulator
MLRRRAPPPTKSAEMIKEYLDIINAKQAQHGKAQRYDIYRRAGSEAQTDRIIKQLMVWGVIKGNKQGGYTKTEAGERMHEILCRHGDLVGIFTQQLKGRRIGRW